MPQKLFYKEPKDDILKESFQPALCKVAQPPGGIDNEIFDTPMRKYTEWNWTRVKSQPEAERLAVMKAHERRVSILKNLTS